MTLPPTLRKLTLTLHVTVSVGWLGAVTAVLALGIVALDGASPPVTRGALLVMEPLARFVLLPLAFAALVTGVAQSLGTPWGLLRHYWVLFKLAITGAATVFLVLYLPTFGELATAAADPASSPEDLTAMALSPVLHAGVAVPLLLAATLLSVVKPRGRTPLAAVHPGGRAGGISFGSRRRARHTVGRKGGSEGQ